MVKVLGRDDCSRCSALKNILTDRGIEHNYSDISQVDDQGARDVINLMIDTKGSYELPVILDIDNNILTIEEVLS